MNLAKVPIPEMVASVTAVTALVIALAGMTKVLSTASGGLTKKVLILLAMAIAVYILAKAVTKIASIPIQQMAVAGAVIVGLTVAISLMGRIMGEVKTKASALLAMVGCCRCSLYSRQGRC